MSNHRTPGSLDDLNLSGIEICGTKSSDPRLISRGAVFLRCSRCGYSWAVTRVGTPKWMWELCQRPSGCRRKKRVSK